MYFEEVSLLFCDQESKVREIENQGLKRQRAFYVTVSNKIGFTERERERVKYCTSRKFICFFCDHESKVREIEKSRYRGGRERFT